jgi:hypothetical protein
MMQFSSSASSSRNPAKRSGGQRQFLMVNLLFCCVGKISERIYNFRHTSYTEAFGFEPKIDIV